MSTKHPNAASSIVASTVDDLKLIHGIGPVIEQRLHEAGLVSLLELAELTPDELIAKIGHVGGLTAHRIAEDDWIGQARQLAARLGDPPAPRQPADPPAEAAEKLGRQRANFTVELVLGQESDVRATRAAHVQSGSQDTWVGWDGARLAEFFVRSAQLRLPAPAEPAASDQRAGGATEAGPGASELPGSVAGVVRLRELAVICEGAARRIVRSGQPFDVRVDLDLSGVVALGGLVYRVNLWARKFGAPLGQPVRELQGSAAPGQPVALAFERVELPEGLHHLDVAVTLAPDAVEPQPAALLSTELQGILLQVY